MLDSGLLGNIENIIGYTFKNKELLLRAFTHASFANEHKNTEDNERLEFLGDAVLGYVIGLYLYETFPDYPEGKLTKIRASVVNRRTIKQIVSEMDILRYLRTSSGKAREDILNAEKTPCDIFEAIIGAMVIDCDDDLGEAKKFIIKNLSASIKIGQDQDTDYKSRAYELCAKKKKKADILILKEPDAASKFFEVAFTIDGEEVSYGSGHNILAASQEACKKFLQK